MFKYDADESVPIVHAVLDALLSWTATRGREGAELRAAVGRVKALAPVLLRTNLIAEWLIDCFELAQDAGITFAQIERVRQVALAQPAVSVGAVLTKDTAIELCLSSAGSIIARTIFISREDVEKVKQTVNVAFDEIEERMADTMDSTTWRVLVKLHAAIIMHLYETARPLPRMLNFRFGVPMSLLVMAHKLYADPGRADELKNENKVVHPAFARPSGKALSA